MDEKSFHISLKSTDGFVMMGATADGYKDYDDKIVMVKELFQKHFPSYVPVKPTTPPPTAPAPATPTNTSNYNNVPCRFCNSPTADNRNNKKTVKSPDYKCGNAVCGAAGWIQKDKSISWMQGKK